MFERGAMHKSKNFLAAQRVLRPFCESVSTNLLKADVKSCSDALFMYDASTGGRPSHRIEDYNDIKGAAQALLTGPFDLHGRDAAKPSDYFTYVALMAGLPEITIPLGQVKYYSHVSREYETLPVAVQVVAHRGCESCGEVSGKGGTRAWRNGEVYILISTRLVSSES